MLIRTHLSFGIFFILIFLPYLDNKLLFIFTVLLGVIFPDLDSKNSSYGKYLIFRPFQFFIKHRGILHSFISAFILGFIIKYFFNDYGFIIGYLSHLILDCLTKQGVYLFWPFSFKIKGFLKSGGLFDELLFLILVSINFILFFINVIFA
ncbi:MAG: metal-dependent hydrolase [Nanoarchaeota archaeon]